MKRLLFTIVVMLFCLPILGYAVDSQTKTLCPNGVNAEGNLVKKVNVSHGPEVDEAFIMKTVDTKDKCYKLSYAKFIYLIDEKHAIYQVDIDYFSKPLVYLDFTESLVKKKGFRTFHGIVKGIGTFQYKNEEGLSKTIPHMVVIKESKNN